MNADAGRGGQFRPREADPEFYANPYRLIVHCGRTSRSNACRTVPIFRRGMTIWSSPTRTPGHSSSDRGRSFCRNTARRCSTSTTPPASSSTIRRAYKGAAADHWRAVTARHRRHGAVSDRLVDRLLDGIAAKGRFELIGDFASAIPIEVIGNLLDVPHEEREPLRDWSLAILARSSL